MDVYSSDYRFISKELDEQMGNFYYGARYYDPKVSVWLSVDPLSHLSPSQTPYHFVSNNPIMRIDPNGLTDYFNLNGEKVHHVNDDKDVQMLVLTKQAEINSIKKAIENKEYISMPTEAVLAAMDDIYSKTESTGNEHGMWVGTEGTTSKIVEGDKSSVPGEKMREAKMDLVSNRNKEKGEVLAYDVHSHPSTGDYYGAPEANEGDMGDSYFPQAKVVLGYRENLIGGGPGKTVYGKRPTNPVQYIGFYNSGGAIETMNYKKFNAMVRKISESE